ncbi:Tigger transposable element-derived protein 6 [Branchiostoma belcheri]|nr:Tigger transposable element-derived protein 6 [Branchiostoma belcheri]
MESKWSMQARRAGRYEKKTLTLGEKIDVIRQYEKGGTGARALAKVFGVGKTQIQNIVKRKLEYLADYENNAPIHKRRNVRQKSQSSTQAKQAAAKLEKKTLTLGEKIDVIRRYERGGTGARGLAKEYGVGKTQIQNIVNRKQEYLADYYENNAPINKRRNNRETANEDINKLCWQYFCETTVRPVTGPMLQQQALKFAEQLGVVGFKASNGWLESFKTRHNIVLGFKSAEIPGTSGDKWADKIADVTTGYSAEDIYNMDETALFFRTTSNQTFMGGDHSYFSGQNQAKDCLTVVLCANMAGGKERPLVIGHSARPMCFKNLPQSSLPVTYAHNKMSWTTSELFLDWLKSFDLKMGLENRNVLLFLDQAPSHPHVRLRNVELVYYPSNTTWRAQPMGQGVVQRFKLKYRKRQLTRILQDMQRHRGATGEELVMQLTVLDAIHWIASAWQDVTENTIQTCFEKAGFDHVTLVNADPVNETGASDSEDQVGMDELSQELFGCDFQELAGVDQDLVTCDMEGRDWNEDATILLDELQASQETETVSDSDDDSDSTRTNPIKDLNTLVDLMKHIKNFCAEEGLGDLLNAFQQADDILNSIWSEGQGTV